MKRSQAVGLLFLTTLVTGLSVGCSRPNHLRPRLNADGSRMYDVAGNPIYEDDEGQHYTHSGGYYHAWYTRGNGFASIPGTSRSAPDTSGGVSASSITGRSVSRGGFGSSGHSFSSHGSSGGAHAGS